MKAVKSSEGKNIRIAGMTGTPSIKDKNGKLIKASVNLLLHDGYSLSTGASEQLYLSIDQKDVLRLEASSEASLSQAGDKLKLSLVSGELHSGLEASALSHVKTSNMATGIRG